MKKYKPETWILVHIIFPMLPSLIESFICLVIRIDPYAINYSTFAASTAILCFFVNQNLLANSMTSIQIYELMVSKDKLKEENGLKNQENHLEGLDEKIKRNDELSKEAAIFLIFGLVSITLFAIMVVVNIFIVINPDFYEYVSKYSVWIFKLTIFSCSIFVISQACKTQSNFKLRAQI